MAFTQDRLWAVIYIGTEGPEHEIAKFRADGDAFLYAKDLVNREGMAYRIWIRPTTDRLQEVRKESSVV